MPKDNIERAIARGAGPGGDGASYETITYEGYGPAGIAVYVEALTDNRNRTAADVRHIFTKSDGSLGESGSVAWLFERRAVVLVDGSADEDELTLAAAEGGADDVRARGRQLASGRCHRRALASVREAIEAAGMTVESAELTMVPKTTVEVDDESAAKKVAATHGRARGQRRRPGRLRELRHPGAGARSRRDLALEAVAT